MIYYREWEFYCKAVAKNPMRFLKFVSMGCCKRIGVFWDGFRMGKTNGGRE
jgi:hypothetical protein